MFIKFFPPMYWNLSKNYKDEEDHWPNLGTMGWALPVSSTTKTKHQNNTMKNRTNPSDLLAIEVQLSTFNCSLYYKLNITHKTNLLNGEDLSSTVNGRLFLLSLSLH